MELSMFTESLGDLQYGRIQFMMVSLYNVRGDLY